MTNRPGRPRKNGRKHWPQNLYKNSGGTFWFRHPGTGEVASLGRSEAQAINLALRLNRAVGGDAEVPVRTDDSASVDADGLLSRGHIQNESKGISTACGIYFLLSAGRIVYVGQSTNCGRRIFEHVVDVSKRFDEYFILECGADALNELEARYIAKFLPALNIQMPRLRAN
jgi:hypothetical protein